MSKIDKFFKRGETVGHYLATLTKVDLEQFGHVLDGAYQESGCDLERLVERGDKEPIWVVRRRVEMLVTLMGLIDDMHSDAPDCPILKALAPDESEDRTAGEWVVRLEPGMWLAPWDGDSGITSQEKKAKGFATGQEAKEGLEAAKKYGHFPDACLTTVCVLSATESEESDDGS